MKAALTSVDLPVMMITKELYQKYAKLIQLPTRKATLQSMAVSLILGHLGCVYPGAMLGSIDVSFTELPMRIGSPYELSLTTSLKYKNLEGFTIRLANSYDQRVCSGKIVVSLKKAK